MRQSKRLVVMIAFVLLSACTVVDSVAQVAAPLVPLAGETWCKSPATMTVTVFLNKSRAVIPRASVVLRGVGKPFQMELQTDANGQAKASVPCGYLDMFATAYDFAPNAKRIHIEKNQQFVAISLDASPQTEN
jgi:hypothetical protein